MFLTKNIPYAKYSLMNYSAHKSTQLFPLTEAIHAYLAVRKTHDAINRIVSKRLAERGLSVPKFGIIRSLYDHESLPLTELSNLIFRGNSNVTTLINRMERDGLVERVNCEGDRRVRRVRLTEKGRELAPKVVTEHRAFLHQMMVSCLPPENHRTLTTLLNQIEKSIMDLEKNFNTKPSSLTP